MNPGNFDHSVTAGEGLRYFVDNFSRVDTTPNAVVIDRDGETLFDLEDADLSKLFEAGYEYPEAFGVKSADGVTDIYGVIYKPFDFDPSKKYPIVAYVYPGPQTESVAKRFSTSASEVALAQLGMIVITIGNRGGNPARSKWYHNYGYGDLRDYGLADKKAGIEQLADRHAWIDIDRVGIYGHSVVALCPPQRCLSIRTFSKSPFRLPATTITMFTTSTGLKSTMASRKLLMMKVM